MMLHILKITFTQTSHLWLLIVLGTLQVVLQNNRLNDLISIFIILTKQMNQKNAKELVARYFCCIYEFTHHMHFRATCSTTHFQVFFICSNIPPKITLHPKPHSKSVILWMCWPWKVSNKMWQVHQEVCVKIWITMV